MRLILIKLLLWGLEMSPKQIQRFRECGWVLAPQAVVDQDARLVSQEARIKGLNSGREIGQLDVMRYTRLNPKWEDIADKFDFEKLNSKYPENPLCQKLK